jgi:hypothetical protein
LPLAWNQKWYRSNRAADTTVGSLTNQLFLIYTRAKLQADLNDSLTVRFVYASQQDREVNDTRQVFELTQTLLDWLKVSAYAQMAHYKRDNDFGLAMNIAPSEYWNNRIYVTYHDFTRGNHNDQPDRFLGDDPEAVGLTSVYDDQTTWIRSGFRFDRSVKWNRPQEQVIFSYEKRLIFAEISQVLSKGKTASIRAQWDSTFKGQAATGTNPDPTESWRLDRTAVRAAFTDGFDEDRVSLEYAFMFANRLWINQLGEKVSHQNLLPSVMTRVRSTRRENGFDHIQLVIEATDFKKYGGIGLTPTNQKNESVEGRLQTAYEFSFRNEANLLVAFNFDLDEWGVVPTFEGGNVQFRSNF